MCNVCGKVMRDDLLKRHMNSKHNNVSSTQHNDEVKAEDSEIEESGNLLVSCGAKLKFELQRDNEVYQKNVDIGEQISISLECENIREKSLSRQIKFCLDLCRPQ